MKSEIADKWIADLRSNPLQTTGCLYDGAGHCCLGRLVLVLGGSFSREDEGDDFYAVSPDGNTGGMGTLPNWAKELSGIRTSTADYSGLFPSASYPGDISLTHLNDTGKTFQKIADVIDKERNNL